MFNIRLKEVRQKSGLTQKELASLLNVSGGSIANWETGLRQPNFITTRRIARIFNISLDYLMGQSNDPSLPGEKLIIPDELRGAQGNTPLQLEQKNKTAPESPLEKEVRELAESMIRKAERDYPDNRETQYKEIMKKLDAMKKLLDIPD